MSLKLMDRQDGKEGENGQKTMYYNFYGAFMSSPYIHTHKIVASIMVLETWKYYSFLLNVVENCILPL